MPKAFSGRDPWAWLMDQTEKVTESGCWIFMGKLGPAGYVYLRVGSRTDGSMRNTTGQRLAYEKANGPLPPGHEADHKCRVRCCINPDHMRALTHRDNILLSNAPSAVNARKTSCSKCGGPYVPQGGQRKCRRCDAERHRRYAAAEREK